MITAFCVFNVEPLLHWGWRLDMVKKRQSRLWHFLTGSPRKIGTAAKSWDSFIQTQRSIFLINTRFRFRLNFFATGALRRSAC